MRKNLIGIFVLINLFSFNFSTAGFSADDQRGKRARIEPGFSELPSVLMGTVFGFSSIKDRICVINLVCSKWRNTRSFGSCFDSNEVRECRLDDDIFRRVLTVFEAHQMRRLSLWANCRIENNGLEDISRLINLNHLTIFGNGPKMTQAGLSHLAAFTDLKELTLIECDAATHGGLAHLDRLPSLESLTLEHDGFTDADLVHVSGLTNLRHLTLCSLAMSDAGFVHLSGLGELKNLFLYCSAFSGEGCVHFAGLDNLEHLKLCCPDMTDAGLQHLKGLHLRTIFLCSNEISDRGIEHLAHLEELTSLELAICPITELGLRFLALSNLKKLSLKNCDSVTEEGLRLFGCSSLERLTTHSCEKVKNRDHVRSSAQDAWQDFVK